MNALMSNETGEFGMSNEDTFRFRYSLMNSSGQGVRRQKEFGGRRSSKVNLIPWQGGTQCWCNSVCESSTARNKVQSHYDYLFCQEMEVTLEYMA